MRVEPDDLVAFLGRVNALRELHGVPDPEGPPRADSVHGILEDVADTLFGASGKLAVYGSLRPGRENHHVVEGLEGKWREGFVRGRLRESGWGAGMGYPALAWDPDGERVPVSLLVSPELPSAWPRIDAFEGAEYRRVLVPVLVPVRDEGGPSAVANLYAVAGAGEESGP